MLVHRTIGVLASTMVLCMSCAEQTSATLDRTGTDIRDYFDCLDEAGVTLVAAHRGTDGTMPENGLESIKAVVAATGGLVEVDVTRSADGVLFLHHDDTLDRTTTGSGTVSVPWSDLRTLSLRDSSGRVTAQSLTALAELFDWAAGRAVLELDIKSGVRYSEVSALMDEYSVSGQTVVITYTKAQAVAAATAFPKSMISASIGNVGELEALIAEGVPAERILAWTGNDEDDPALYDALDSRGVEVIFGTLGGYNSIDDRIARSGRDDAYVELASNGVDILATDRPIQAFEALDDGGVATAPSCTRPVG